MSAPGRIALVVRSLNGGGIERVMLTLAGAFTQRGHAVDLVVGRPQGALATQVPEGVRLVTLSPSLPAAARVLTKAGATNLPGALGLFLGPSPLMLRRLFALARYLSRERPHALLAAGTQSNLAALWARAAARSDTRVVISEHNTLSSVVREARRRFRRRYPVLATRSYPAADAIVAVSAGVAEDLAARAGIPRGRIRIVYNPVVSMHASAPLQSRPRHPWLAAGGPPLVVSAGRLHRQKDFPTLLKAFARVLAERPARLVILGEGTLRHPLQMLARRLGVAPALAMPGFVADPRIWMRVASVFVLSSAWEGFGNVLCEALGCGCPVVSTDCPHGPREILEGGRYGRLVPVGDDAAMARAILAALEAPLPAAMLRRRAAAFSVEAATARYLELLLRRPATPPLGRRPGRQAPRRQPPPGIH